jgi:hypothetical protein
MRSANHPIIPASLGTHILYLPCREVYVLVVFLFLATRVHILAQLKSDGQVMCFVNVRCESLLKDETGKFVPPCGSGHVFVLGS